MAPKSVPSKIVIAGNSKMSLNDRFTSIPKPRTQPQIQKPKYAPKKVYQQVYEQIPQNFYQKPRARPPRPAFTPRRRPVVQVPIQNRVTFVKTIPQQRAYVPNFQYQKPFIRKPTFKPNFVQNRFNKFPAKTFANVPAKKSVAELDRELDDYMRKSKHTPITI